MDKNAIRKFAIWAREELIKRVSTKAEEYGISKETVVDAEAESIGGRLLSKSEIKQRQELIAKIKKDGYEQVIEEVAYTWFNRFIALRFMEVNNYLPSHVRVFTDDENAFNPQILTEAIHLELKGLDIDKVIALKQVNKNEDLYKYLLITQCNALSSILPRMFQKIDDYTELLFPDNVLRTGSVLEQMITLIPEEDWTDQVQIIGWLYQYYNSVPKDKVFANLKKNIKIRKEDIPAATQLFTPDWIVRYMVENSLGRTVINNLTYDVWNDDEKAKIDVLKSKWKYYLDDAPQEPEVIEQLRVLEHHKYGSGETLPFVDATFIDPCMGSGHILVYAFDVFMDIYRIQGWSDRDAAQRIVEKNIYGLDIDERASQLAYFAVMMKARQYDRRFFSRGIQPNVYSIVESNRLDPNGVDAFINGDADIKKNFDLLCEQMYDAKEYGSIIKITGINFDLLYRRLDEMRDEIDLFTGVAIQELTPLFDVAYTLARKYDAVVTNPPYMGLKGMGGKLGDYVVNLYKDSKGDLSTVFMERCNSFSVDSGYISMINIPVWMFINSYTNLRKKLLSNVQIINMLHLGRGVFGSDFGTTSFVLQCGRIDSFQTVYHKLYETQGGVDSLEDKETWFFERKGRYTLSQNKFLDLPNYPIAYWASENVINTFSNKKLGDIATVKKGMSTADDDRFIRFWHEVAQTKVNSKWFKVTKGGEYRKWYGNQSFYINWECDGSELKNFPKAVLRNTQYYFKESICWNYITISKISFKYYDGFAFTAAAPCVQSEEHLKYILGFGNSVVANDLIMLIGGTTVTFEVGEVANLPLMYIKEKENTIATYVDECINISKSDWDAFETSWDFRRHPLIAVIPKNRVYFDDISNIDISECYMCWELECNTRFDQLKANEEKLNRIFIDIYGLQDEMTPEIEDKDVTVRKADLHRDIRSFISYAVGCMFGRYSLDVEGLAYAGGEWDASKYTTFAADADNIIPICDDEYFDDDIVGRFVKFVETVYGKQTLQDNLKFIADALGGKGSPKEVIRNYFLNDFYADHVKIYQKRPIYWLFDSGKKNGFKALIYMHRYQPDTLARMRTDYVHEQQARYRTAIQDLEHRIAGASTSERVKMTKQLSSLKEQDTEIRVYEEKIHHLADQMIRIDLDDGVNHNYLIFKDVLKDIGIKEKKN